MIAFEPGHRLKALVVDDERSIVEVVRLVLNAADFETHTTLDSMEVCELIRKVEPDVLITDYRMPKLSGIDLINIVRNTHPELPVVLMTAQGSFNMPEDLDRTLYKSVQKPFRNDDLINKVKCAIARTA